MNSKKQDKKNKTGTNCESEKKVETEILKQTQKGRHGLDEPRQKAGDMRNLAWDTRRVGIRGGRVGCQFLVLCAVDVHVSFFFFKIKCIAKMTPIPSGHQQHCWDRQLALAEGLKQSSL